MNKKEMRSYLSALFLSLLVLAFIGVMGIDKASANPATRLFIYPATAAPTPPTVWPIGTTRSVQVRIDTRAGYGAPHETTEPVARTDKTWSWEVKVSWDPAVLDFDSTYGVVRSTTVGLDWFNYFHKYAWDDIELTWMDLGPFSQTFTPAWDAAEGWVSAYCSLMATDDPALTPIPTGETPFPQKSLHVGNYYDLPYTDGLSTVTAYTYMIMYSFRLKTKVEIPPGYSAVNIDYARLWEYDGVTLYEVTAETGSIGTPPAPEFPLGLAPIMILAPLIPIVYLWRTRKKVMKQ